LFCLQHKNNTFLFYTQNKNHAFSFYRQNNNSLTEQFIRWKSKTGHPGNSAACIFTVILTSLRGQWFFMPENQVCLTTRRFLPLYFAGAFAKFGLDDKMEVGDDLSL